MGYQVYWSNGRFQGYGVPAYCDYPGCKEVIDRGMGYKHNQDEPDPARIFCCKTHQDYGLPEDFEPEEKEHPEWLRHILTDTTWGGWRVDNPKVVNKYSGMLEELK